MKPPLTYSQKPICSHPAPAQVPVFVSVSEKFRAKMCNKETYKIQFNVSASGGQPIGSAPVRPAKSEQFPTTGISRIEISPKRA